MSNKKIIRVRFAPDGTVFEIGERPHGLPAQEWFAKLSQTAGSNFETLSGGRGVFRLSVSEIEALKASALH